MAGASLDNKDNTGFRAPNIVVVITDDQSWGDLGCHGNPYIRTPNLDHLHSESARFVRYYSGPLCSPARASLMTGRYHYRTGVTDTYLGRSLMHTDEVTIAEVLQQHGYATGLFGKWHLGDNYPMRAIDQGFSEAVTHRGGGIGQPADPPDNSYFDTILQRNGEPTRYEGYCTDIFTDEAVRFIETNREGPFFVYLALNCPHSPFEIASEWVDPYLEMGIPETFARVYGMIENIDANVGRLLQRIDDFGISEDTIVVFTSDHGPCPSARHNGESRYNAGLRGIKGTMYDGGIRVPCLFRWPRRVKAGRDIEQIAHPIDLMPTLASAAGASLPAAVKVDGVNLLPLLTDQGAASHWPDRMLFMQWHRGNVPERYRNYAVINQRYKLYRPQTSRSSAPAAGGLTDELYDMIEDPGEQRDIAGEMPEIVASMRRAYDRWFDDVSSTRGEATFDPPSIHLGTPHENPTVLTWQDWRLYDPDNARWSYTNPGWWQVFVTRPGRFVIHLHMPPLDDQATARFQCGSTTAEQDVQPTEEQCTFCVELEPGNHRLEAWIDVDGRRIGPMYVVVEVTP